MAKNKLKKVSTDELKNIVYELGKEICITNYEINNPCELSAFKKLYHFVGLDSKWINKKIKIENNL
jgi:hypothetical protein